MKKVRVIGAGLAGSEATYQLAKRGFEVELYEMKGIKKSPAHKLDTFAELVCSNSMRSDDINTGIGLLHAEMRLLDSLIIKTADLTKIPAGSALAVDRDIFSQKITDTLKSFNNVKIISGEVKEVPNDDTPTIIATGPLTSESLFESIKKLLGIDYLHFFDALAPIVYKDTINMDIAWRQSRFDKGEGNDYINCPLDKEQYYKFIEALINAEKTEFKDFEKNTPYFEGCLPIEVMASRGVETLAYGPMKPIGLTNPKTNKRAYAVVQLRQDNQLGTLYNIVGFQTKMTYSAQKEVFRTIPGLENAEFARLGGIHRNTFINSPKLLDKFLRLKSNTNIRFAGQITGCEGYVESASIGLISAIFLSSELNGINIEPPSDKTALGGLLSHITTPENANTFQPMNINYGLINSGALLNEKGKPIKGNDKKSITSQTAIKIMEEYLTKYIV